MILPRRLVLLGAILAVLPAAAQTPPLDPAPRDRAATSPEVSAADEHTARLVGRYKAMLAANPAAGLALDRLWTTAAERGDTAQLLDEYGRAARAQPARPATILVDGLLLQKAGRLDDAKAELQRAAAADPSNVLAPLALGDLAVAGGKPGEAAGDYEVASALLPASDRRLPDILLKLGNSWLAAGDPGKAAAAWEKIVAANPSDVTLHQRLAENYEKNRLPAQAIAHYEYIEQHAAPDQRAGALRELGRLHESRGEIDAASAALERGLALTARDNWLHAELEQSLIRLYQRAGRVPELDARWQADVARAPRDLGAYLRLEHLAAAQGDADAERTWLEQIVALAPQDRGAALDLARLLTDAGDRDRAAALYDALLKDEPGNLDLVLARAELDLQLGRPQAAVERINACVALTPTDESVTTPALQFLLAHHLDEAAERRLQAEAAREPDSQDAALALAKFYFSQRREPAARAALETLLHEPGTAAAKTARLLRAADCYKDERLFDDALRCWSQAADLDPAATAPWLAAADALASEGKTDEAQGAYEHAIEVAPAAPGRVDIERKLFGLLQGAETRKAGPASIESLPTGKGFGAAEGSGGARLTHYIAQLEQTARKTPTPDAYLRLARWQAWNHSLLAAGAAADKVITLDPANIPARELLVSLAGETHQRDAAEQRLREIMTLDPARSNACRRQIAELKMEDGDFDAAIAAYSSLQQDQPGSVAALTDLALAQQRVDRWFDALNTWERAYALPGATAAERADVRKPMLLALERLGQFPRGAEVLAAAIGAENDLAAKQDLFRELAAYCQQHNLTGWLQQQYETRLTAEPNDYFTLMALANLQKAGGHDREGYRLQKEAAFSAPDPIPSLRGLVAAAADLGETAEAVSWQRRLLALAGQNTADNLEKLADLQDEGLATDDASRTWEQALARFPRQTEVLEKAVDFYEKARQPGRARDLLLRLVELEPAGLQRLFQLGQLDLAAQDRQGARDAFEKILDRSDAEKPGLAVLAPGELKAAPPRPDGGFAAAVARFRTRFAVAAPEAEPPPGPADERQFRLAAIRQLSMLFFPQADAADAKSAPGPERDRRQWLERWKTAAANGARTEPLWAFYYAREQALTMGALAGWMQASPEDEVLRETFASAGMHLGAYRSLAHWTWDDANREHIIANGQYLVAALIDYLDGGGKPAPGMVTELFPQQAAVRELLWKAAQDGFAAHDRYAEAAELGERVVSLAASARVNFALPVSQWELYLGRSDRARSVLRTALAEGGGESFERSTNPIFTALREYFLLLPESERAGFVDEYLHRMNGLGGPAYSVLAAVLLHGLAGDLATANADIDRLLALRMLSSDSDGGLPDFRRWEYLLINGLQLQEWGLEPLALHLWKSALRETSAFERQDNETLSVRSEIRTHLLGLEVALAPDPARARQHVEDYLREEPLPGNVAILASQFRESAQWPSATALYEYLCRVEPADPQHWRDLFAAYQATGSNSAFELALTTLLAGKNVLPNGLSRVDLICRKATVLEEEGDGAGARDLLERARLRDPQSFPFLAQLANSYLLAGQAQTAAEIWRQAIPFDAEGRAALALASIEEGRNHPQDAIGVLQQTVERVPGSFEAVIELGVLYAAAGRLDDLRALASERLQAGDLNALIGLGARIVDAPGRAVVREILTEAVQRAHDPLERFRAQRGVVDSYRTAAGDGAAFETETRRLERFAGMTPALRIQFLQERFDVSRQRGADAWLDGELQRDWREGDGEVAAGEMLVRLYLQTGRAEALRKVVAEVDRRPDLPELTLFAIEEELAPSKYAGLALPVAQRLTRRFPQKEAYALARSRVCWMAGRPDEARSLLEELDATSVFSINIADQIGDLYLALGDRSGAREFLGRAVTRDPFALRSPQTYLHLAQADIEAGQPDEARRLLLVAYRNPACTDLSPLLAYLSATGHDGPDAANRLPGSEFPLSTNGRARLLAAICENLDKTHRPADARRLAMAHPELWSDAPGVAEYLCARSGVDELAALAAALEDAVAQASPPSGPLARALSGLYVRWAATERTAADQAPEALTHLARAHELQPADFSIARQLAELYIGRKQTARATDALRDFLTPDAPPARRQEAQQVLATK